MDLRPASNPSSEASSTAPRSPVKPSPAAIAGLLILSACQTGHDWRTYNVSRAAFGEAPDGLQGSVQSSVEAVPTEDELFVQNAAANGLFAVDGARLALSKDVTDPVRRFARMMIDDHARATAEYRDFLRRKALAAPVAESSARLDELAALEGASFERAYLESERVSHAEAIRFLEQCGGEEEEDVDADKQALAQRLLPTLRVHVRELDHILRAE